jgi:hypothetical protein
MPIALRPARVMTRLMDRPSSSSRQTGMPGLDLISRISLRPMRLDPIFAAAAFFILSGTTAGRSPSDGRRGRARPPKRRKSNAVVAFEGWIETSRAPWLDEAASGGRRALVRSAAAVLVFFLVNPKHLGRHGLFDLNTGNCRHPDTDGSARCKAFFQVAVSFQDEHPDSI